MACHEPFANIQTQSFEACSAVPRSLHDTLSKLRPSVKLYVANNSEIGETWSLLGSLILYSLKGKYTLCIYANAPSSNQSF